MAGDCIEFEGARNKGGYGVLPREVNGSRLAHRASLAEYLGRPVQGIVRHSCDNPPCINPEHLIEGTQQSNVDDAVERGRVRGGRYAQTHCMHGHELTPDNVQIYERPSRRSVTKCRRCMECRRIANQKQAAKRKAARHARGLLKTGRKPSHGK